MLTLENAIQGNFNAFFNPVVLDIVEKFPMGIILCDHQGKVIYVNQKLEYFLGYSPSEIIGFPHKDAVRLLLGKYYSYETIKSDWDKLEKGASLINIRKFSHKQGQTVPLEVMAYPLYNEGNFAGELLLLKDVQEELLVKVTKLVNSSFSLKKVLQNTANAVVDYLGLASTTIFLLNKNKTEVLLHTCTVFPDEQEINKVKFKVGHGLPGKVVQTREITYVRNLSEHPDVSEQARKFHGNESGMLFPLIFQEEVLGIMAFNADIVREFTAKEKAVFENVTNQVALAIYNAQLFTKLEYLSITDGLTSLYNHRYFHEALYKEIERSKRNKHDLTLLMMDIDNFKNYNDSYGHVHGDDLLKQIAVLIKENVRSFDIAARYGGEEFAVLLVDCDIQKALEIAHRMKNTIEQYPFYGREAQPSGKVTISIGVESFKEMYDGKTLIQCSDKALYKAKNTGRNRVVIYDDITKG